MAVPIGGPGYAAVLVDIVGSREHPDRAALQSEIVRAAEAVNAVEPSLDPLTPTVGDELQATYAGVEQAIRAIVRLRLELLGTVALRAAIGWGEIVIHDPDRSPFGQDGPAWWAARRALDALDDDPARFGGGRLAIDVAEPATPPCRDRDGLPPPAPLDIGSLDFARSHLILLDRAIARLDAVEARILLGDIDARPTADIAAQVGITPSGVSQRRRRNNLRGLAAAINALGSRP